MSNPYGSAEQQLVRHFRAWETRGRGWAVFPFPVALEPPFRPFPGHYVWQPPVVDNTRRPGLFSLLLGRGASTPAELPPASLIDPEEPEPEEGVLSAGLTELRVLLPEKFELGRDAAEQLLLSLRFCTEPVSFELVASASTVFLQFAVRDTDAPHVLSQLQAFAPSASIISGNDNLSGIWFSQDAGTLIVDLGLSEEFMRPIRGLRAFSVDPWTSVVGALASLGAHELAVLQVLFQPAESPWSESILRSVHDPEGKPFFATGPECASQAKQKIAKPLFAVRPRIAIRAYGEERRMGLLRMLMGALSPLGLPGSNELVALDAEGWEEEDQLDDLLFRAAHRSGMLLNAEELASLVHLPGTQVVNPRFERHNKQTKEAPPLVRQEGVLLGSNEHMGRSAPVCLPTELRTRHTYVIGGSGTGKSTLLLNLILQDIAEGCGLAVLDPHGDLVDGILARMPEERTADVILLNPADEEFSVGLNILTAYSETEKTLLSSDLVSVFRRLSSSWGDQMNAVLGNALLAFLESAEGGTLLELRRFLVDKDFRKRFLRTVQDPEVVYFWEKEFPLLIGRAASPLLTRLDTFLRPRLIRNMVAQRRSLDFRAVMDGRKILLAKLAQGAIGEENAYLLGTLIVSKLHQVALSRADTDASARSDFFLYVDEFQHFITPSMASLLSGVRKYGLGLTLAHQNLGQLGRSGDELIESVLANASTRICFRLGDPDAKRLASGFSFFEPRDFQNLGVGEAICRVGRSEDDFNLRTAPLPEVLPEVAAMLTAAVVASSLNLYATPKAELPGILPEPELPEVQETPPEPASKPAFVEAPAAPPPIPVSVTGRGGQQHRYLQTLIKRLGEERGFRASLEVAVLSGTGNVDVVLEREGLSVACEISVTTPTGHEVGNLQKCLAAGYSRVVLVSPTERNLARVRKRAVEVFSPDEMARLHFVLPESLPELLDQMGLPASRSETMKGYKVSVSFSAVDEERKAAKAEAIRDVITRTLRRNKKE